MSKPITFNAPTIAPNLKHLDHLPIGSLVPLQGDLKELTAANYKKLKGRVLERGIIVPFYVWRHPETDVIYYLDGHQRDRVFKREGWLMDVPVVFIDAPDVQTAKEILLEISSQYGHLTQEGWDEFTFDLDTDWLKQTVHFDALPFVFGDWEVEEEQESGDAEPGVTEAEADKYQEMWQVKEGDVWRIGRHFVTCIDCLDETAVSQFLDGAMVNFVWADPPYGIDIVAANGYVGGGEAYDIPFGGVKKRRGYVGGGDRIKARTGLYPIQTWKKEKSRLGSANAAKPFGSKNSPVRGSVGAANIIDVGKYAPVIGDETTETAVKSSIMLLEMFGAAFHVWWGGNYYASSLPNSPCWLIWDKENTGNFADCEMAWTNHGGAAQIFKHMWNGMLKDSEHGQRRVHPTQKPIALAHWAFGKFGDEGDVIFDPFLGSGISVLAAEELDDGRIVYGCDLAPAYVATTIQRWVTMTGGEPELVT